MEQDNPKPRKGIPFGTRDTYVSEDHRLAAEDPKGTRVIEEFGKKLLITNAQYYFIWPMLTRAERRSHFDNVKKKGVRKTYVTVKQTINGEEVETKVLTQRTNKPQI